MVHVPSYTNMVEIHKLIPSSISVMGSSIVRFLLQHIIKGFFFVENAPKVSKCPTSIRNEKTYEYISIDNI